MTARKSALKRKIYKRWYFGTRLNKWVLSQPSKVPEYKRNEGVSRTLMKKIGRKKAHKMVMGGASFIK